MSVRHTAHHPYLFSGLGRLSLYSVSHTFSFLPPIRRDILERENTSTYLYCCEWQPVAHLNLENSKDSILRMQSLLNILPCWICLDEASDFLVPMVTAY
ncbi:hypothetical protein CDAR_615701 [Caerostris darwini]|uniref:Uncharacterized protein n=1 Tax=Caerostris darwini TaxID=1538125 RepID=A0AAV4RXV3_9ARAC|nr:hypothetical protein CDAR_615701 [Caerostris darwini]